MRTYSLLLTVASIVAFHGFNQIGCAEEGAIAIAELKRDTAVDFEKEILPIMRRKCLACHNNTDAESDLVLETPQSILKGGSEGPAAVPGKGAESLLLRVTARQAEPFMPPEDNDVGAKPLTPEELGLLKLWIEQGAKGEVRGQAELNWQPLPPGVNPIYSVTVSPDGQFVAAGRANQIFMYHVPSKREVGRLTDPALMETDIYNRPGVSHLDLVQSLQFSPDSQLLASGGYRTVKIWRRAPNDRKLSIVDLESLPTAVAVSPDGKAVAISQQNGSVLLMSGVSVKSLSGHKEAVTGIRFFGEGSRIVTSSLDRTFRVFSASDGEPLLVVETPSPLNDVELVEKESRIATAGADNVVRLWELPESLPDAEGTTLEPSSELKGHSGPITSLARVGAAGAQLLSGSQDGTFRYWEVGTGKVLRQVKHGGPVESVAAHPDGSRFASASSDNTAKLWNPKGEQLAILKGDFRRQIRVEEVEQTLAVAKRQIENTKADLKAVTDRKTAEEKNAKTSAESVKKAKEDLAKKEEAAKKAVADKQAAEKTVTDSKSQIASAETAKKNAEAVVALTTSTLANADADIQSAQEAVQAAQKLLDDAKARSAAVTKAAAGVKKDALAVKGQAEKGVQQAAKQIESAQAAAKKAEEDLKKVTQATDKVIGERDAAKKTLESATRTASRADAAVMKVTDQIPQVEVTVKQSEEKAKQVETLLATVKKEAGESEKPFRAIAFSLDGRSIATGGADQSVRTWDAQSGAAIETYAGHAAELRGLAFTPTGDVVSIAADKTVYLWNTNPEWKLAQTFGSPDSPQFEDRVTALDFSPDSKLLATGGGEPSRSGELKILNVADGTLVKEITDAHSDTIFGLDFSPDGKQIASCGADRFAKIFDVQSGEFVRAFEGHTHHVLGVSWRADGRQLATSGADNVIKVWDVVTGDQKRTITGFGKEVTAVRFVASGDNVVASSGDKSVQMKNATNGRNVRGFSGATDFMYCVMTSRNGKLIAAGGQDSVVRIWSDDGKVLVNFSAPQLPTATEGD